MDIEYRSNKCFVKNNHNARVLFHLVSKSQGKKDKVLKQSLRNLDPFLITLLAVATKQHREIGSSVFQTRNLP